ncbi:hypothetical protein X566_02390 [Afipia sp. P52-10]|nr:hypothetical protein X566_02390 [Afipia sp. P52-10]
METFAENVDADTRNEVTAAAHIVRMWLRPTVA